MRWVVALTTIMQGADAPLQSVTVAVAKGEIARGAEVKARVTAAGKVGFESELKAASWQVEVKGTAEVGLGAASEPGLYVCSAVLGKQRWTGALALLPSAAPGKFDLEVIDLGSKASPHEVNATLLGKFWKGLTRERLEKAARQVIVPWVKENSIGAAHTAVICAIPGFQVTCALRSAGHAVDLGLSLLQACVDVMVADKVLNPDEGKDLKTALGLLNMGAQVALESTRLERLLTAIGEGLSLVFEEGSARISVKAAREAAGKYLLLLQVARK